MSETVEHQEKDQGRFTNCRKQTLPQSAKLVGRGVHKMLHDNALGAYCRAGPEGNGSTKCENNEEIWYCKS